MTGKMTAVIDKQLRPNGVAAAGAPARLVSLDALRGFAMFWIIGTDDILVGLNAVVQQGEAHTHSFVAFLAEQFQHVAWEGFHFYDLIFPLFIFVMGASVVLSLEKTMAAGGRRTAYKRIVRRFVLLYLLGMWCEGGVSTLFRENLVCGVLQRLALCYLITSLLYCHLGRRGLVSACVLMLVGYWAVLAIVPNPENGQTTLLDEHNLIHYIDKHIPPDYAPDSESLPSVFPSVSGCLMGVLAAQRLRRTDVSARDKVLGFLIGGALMAATGYLWGMQFPLIKKLWTSSFILVASGYSLMLIGVFYLIVDVWKFQRWAWPFIWIGSNALAIYLAMRVVNFKAMVEPIVGGPIAGAMGPYRDLFLTAAAIVAAVLCLRYLYRQKIFIRI